LTQRRKHSLAFAALASYELSKRAWRHEARRAIALIISLTLH
jgi:hypothetical protein